MWMEPVPAMHMTRLVLVPNIDTSTLAVTAFGNTAAAGMPVTTAAFDASGAMVATATGAVGQPFELHIPRAVLWSPESPYLYNLTVCLLGPNPSPNPTTAAPASAHAPSPAAEVTTTRSTRRMLTARAAPAAAPMDVVRSYFGMRKVSVGRDAAGNVRLRLNNRPVFMLGMLDQVRPGLVDITSGAA